MPATPDAPRPETILAFDFGLRRIGIAVGQDITASASPLGIATNGDSGPDFTTIADLIREWRPNRLIVGMPSHADGSPSAIHEHVTNFVEALGRYQLPINCVDERHSSVEAEATLKHARVAGTRGRISKGMIDSAAAVVIAERFLASRT